MAASPSPQRSLVVVFTWVFVLASTSCIASVTSANDSVEWPFSMLLTNVMSEAEECSRVSGFRFRNNTSPNAQQLALMCADPNCVKVTTLLFPRVPQLPESEASVAAFSAFTVPVLDYCWYMREPGTPCPADKWTEFLSHVQDKDANCAREMGYSFVDPSKKEWAFTDADLDVVCQPDCWPLAIRLWYLYRYMPCPMARPQFILDISQSLKIAGFCWYHWGYIGAPPRPPNSMSYAYTAGWPLPPTPTTPPTIVPKPSPTSSTSSGSTDSELPPEVGFPDDEEPTSSNNAVTDFTVSRRPSSTSEASIENAVETPREQQEQDATGSIAPSVTKKPQGAARKSSSRGEPQPTSTLPGATLAPDLTASTQSSGDNLLPALGASALGVVFMAAIFVFSKRRIKGGSKEGTNDDFTTMASPSAGTSMRLTATTSSDGAKVSLATIVKTTSVKHIQDIRILGAGGYGVVYLVRDTLNDRLLASKRLAKTKQLTNDRIDAFVREIQLVSTIQHPCIVTFVGATWTNRTDVQALFEYMDGGDLRTYLDNTPVPVAATIQATQHAWTSEKLSIAIDIADALDYVHSARDRNTPLVHRDLKSRNVLLSMSPRRAKLSDFGVSRELSNNMSMTDGVGTSRWLAPEVILGGGDYGTACDVYSFGVVLSELDTHKLPFWDCGGGGDVADGIDSVVPEIVILRMVAMEGVQPSFSGSCPPKLLELARQCLSHNPADRPTAAAIAKTLRELQ